MAENVLEVNKRSDQRPRLQVPGFRHADAELAQRCERILQAAPAPAAPAAAAAEDAPAEASPADEAGPAAKPPVSAPGASAPVSDADGAHDRAQGAEAAVAGAQVRPLYWLSYLIWYRGQSSSDLFPACPA